MTSYNTISHKTANSQRADNIKINEYGLLLVILDMYVDYREQQ